MIRQFELVERVRSYDKAADEDALNRAYVFSMKAHGSQKRASGDPYFSHPLEVAGILTEFKLDSASIITGLLHDPVYLVNVMTYRIDIPDDVINRADAEFLTIVQPAEFAPVPGAIPRYSEQQAVSFTGRPDRAELKALVIIIHRFGFHRENVSEQVEKVKWKVES